MQSGVFDAFWAYGNKDPGGSGGWQRYYGFHVLLRCEFSRKAGQTVGQTDTAELVHLSYPYFTFLGCMSLLYSCMMGGALPHNLPAYFCRVFPLRRYFPGFLSWLHTRGVWNPGFVSKEGNTDASGLAGAFWGCSRGIIPGIGVCVLKGIKSLAESKKGR